MYRYPQYYEQEERMAIINKHLAEGMDFWQIGNLFSGVGGSAIKYHYNRYHLKRYHLKKGPRVKQRDVYKDYLTELHKAGLL